MGSKTSKALNFDYDTKAIQDNMNLMQIKGNYTKAYYETNKFLADYNFSHPQESAYTSKEPISFQKLTEEIVPNLTIKIPYLKNAFKNTISSMSQDELIAARGTQLTDIITKESNSDIASYGIEIKLAEIKALDLPEDNKQAVYERMISERKNIAAGYTAQGNAEAQKIKNETDREVQITIAQAEKQAEEITAEGEAQYMKILSDAYNEPEKADFYNFIRSLDALEKSLKNSNSKTIMLDKDSELARILYGNYN